MQPSKSKSWTRLLVGAALIVTGLRLEREVVSTARAEDERSTALLKTFVEEFVSITPGEGTFPASFQMGSKTGVASEQPQHEVTFKHKFAMAKYEVPQNLYEAVMGDNPSKWKGPRNSVEMMTWKDANEFCRKATEQLRDRKLIGADEVIRLPTEAEWEYCCRAGTTTRYSFGDEAQPAGEVSFDVLLTGFGANKAKVVKVILEATSLDLKDVKLPAQGAFKPLRLILSQDDATKLKEGIEQAGGTCTLRTAILLDKYGWHTGNAAGNDPPIGELKPNPWGLYDMHGYLWELTADEWQPDYKQAPKDGSAAKGADGSEASFVVRSGSWKDRFDKLTSSSRRKLSATASDDALGFRCVKGTATSR